MNKLCIVTCNHKREQILKLYCEGIKRIQSQTDIEIISIIVGDVNSITKDYPCIHIPYKNNPLTEKFNIACLEAQKHNPDYVVVMGSDDIFNIELLDYVNSRPDCDFINPRDVHLYSVSPPHVNQIIYICSSTIGCARFIRNDLMDKLEWRPWRIHKDKGIDQMLWRELTPRWVSPHLFIGAQVGAKVIDIKSTTNITGFDKWSKSVRLNPDDILTFLSDAEKDIIKQLLTLHHD